MAMADESDRLIWPLPEELKHMLPQFRMGYLQARQDGLEIIKDKTHKHVTTYQQAVEHLNRVMAFADMSIPPTLTCYADAALFLLHSHREHKTQITVSVYDYALAVEKLING